eukprot:CAMPEP_0179337204 /NCGR_PEP_ID=MMETSP0797-20121207/67491_1 /TAXON_ID=47934 /ORGANISM="Dinophysis acuminata, Strain DAEP01" /LENGTH=36 /DNA_ID= /DNA_START= /DNA_END= /DNA_ORIENTATION=
MQNERLRGPYKEELTELLASLEAAKLRGGPRELELA